MRSLLERRHLTEAELVEDAAGVLIAKVVDSRALPFAQGSQRRRRELWRKRESLQTRENAVATEHRHEPRQPGRGKAPAAGG